MRHCFGDALVHCFFVGKAMQIGSKGRFIGIVNSRELRQLSCSGFPVQALRIAALANFERSINKDLNKSRDLAAQFFAH